MVLVFKSTSLAYTITLMEVMGYSQLLYRHTYDVMVFGAAGIIYLVVNGLLTLMMRLIERKALALEQQDNVAAYIRRGFVGLIDAPASHQTSARCLCRMQRGRLIRPT